MHRATARQVELTGGTTKSYSRMHRGLRQQVHQYPTPHPAHPAPKDTRTDWGKIPTTKMAWRDLNKGDVVDFGGEPWKVLETYVNGPGTAGTKTSSIKGKAGKANTKGTTSGKVNPGGTNVSTGSQGTGLNTGSGAKSSAPSTSPVSDLLENLLTGRRIHITLSPAFTVWVY